MKSYWVKFAPDQDFFEEIVSKEKEVSEQLEYQTNNVNELQEKLNFEEGKYKEQLQNLKDKSEKLRIDIQEVKKEVNSAQERDSITNKKQDEIETTKNQKYDEEQAKRDEMR